MEVSTDTITNLTSIVKDNLVQSHEKFQQIARDLVWLNITVHAQSEIFTIRQVEFALIRLNQQMDELAKGVQCAIQGKLPISFINPTVLLSILKMYRYNCLGDVNLLLELELRTCIYTMS